MTTTTQIGPPQAAEYNPYYGRYISLVPSENIIGTLERQVKDTLALLSTRSEQDANCRYAPEKWSIKQVLGHIIDTERIFAYRVLRFARNDQTPIEGYEQDDYVRNASFENRRWIDLLEEFRSVRNATLTLLRGLDEASWTRRGIANKNEISVRALVYVVAGHELHHVSILQQKYFPLLPS